MSKTNNLTRIATFVGFANPDGELHTDWQCAGDSAVLAGGQGAEIDAMSPGIMLPGDRVVLRRATRTSAWFVRGIA
jgi:hypothetical protein